TAIGWNVQKSPGPILTLWGRGRSPRERRCGNNTEAAPAFPARKRKAGARGGGPALQLSLKEKPVPPHGRKGTVTIIPHAQPRTGGSPTSQAPRLERVDALPYSNAEGAVSVISVASIVVRSSIATIVAPAVSTSVHPPVNSAPVP